MPDPKPYARRPYNPDKHCGHPKDRTPETLLAKMAKKQEYLDSLQRIGEERELTVGEKVKLKKCGRQISFCRIALEKLEKYGPDDRPCINPKGKGTSHPGVGYCKMDCECQGKDGWHMENKFSYSPRKRKQRLSALMEEIAIAGHDLLDMEPDVLLLRAKVKDFAEQKGDDLDAESIKSVTILMEQIRKTVDSMNDKRFKASISLDLYNLILFKIGEVLQKRITDSELLEVIIGDMERISVEQTATKKTQAFLAGKGDV